MKKIKLTKRTILVIIISALFVILLAIAAGILFNNGTEPQTEYVNEGFEETESEDTGSEATEETEVSAPFSAEEVFVQHDEKDQDIYFLSSQGDLTTVYQIINVKLTAGKQWTETGRYVDHLERLTSATAPDDYISVKENETYFVRLFGLHDNYPDENGKSSRITPILYKDDNEEVVESAMGGTYSDGEAGVELTIPAGATRMYVTCTDLHAFSVQKKLIVNKEQFDQIKSRQDTLLDSLDRNHEDYRNDPILYD